MSEIGEGGEIKSRLIDRGKRSIILGRPDRTIIDTSEYQTSLPLINEALTKSWAWHGTGRFQYNPKDRNQVRDVLETIVAEGGLIPHQDVLDFTQGEMKSVSTSPAWLYSFMYAQYHYEKGKSFFERGRNGLIWAYYLAPMAYRALKEAYIKKNPAYDIVLHKETRDPFRKAARGFHDKATKTKVENPGMLHGGVSDIPGNYPLLIGIRKGAFQPRHIAGALDKHEMRSETPITFEDFTHIEVPADKVEEVKSYLQNHGKDTPVYPIEWVIETAKQLPPKVILDGNVWTAKVK